MNLDDVKIRIQRKNAILFSRTSPCLAELLNKIALQKHRTLVLWAFMCAQDPLQALAVQYPFDKRPQTALDQSKQWASGKIKMPDARAAILQVHAMAKEVTSLTDAALCHAVGQACATVHTETHAIGLPIYELTAIVRDYGIEECTPYLKEKLSYYRLALEQCRKEADSPEYKWAPFLLDDSRPNKEKIRLEKGL